MAPARASRAGVARCLLVTLCLAMLLAATVCDAAAAAAGPRTPTATRLKKHHAGNAAAAAVAASLPDTEPLAYSAASAVDSSDSNASELSLSEHEFDALAVPANPDGTCNAGFYKYGSSCTQCANGRYSEAGWSTCLLCYASGPPANSGLVTTGVRTTVQKLDKCTCLAGFGDWSGFYPRICKPCPVNTYNADNENNNGAPCVSCDAGKHSDYVVSTGAITCYTPSAAGTVCTGFNQYQSTSATKGAFGCRSCDSAEVNPTTYSHDAGALNTIYPNGHVNLNKASNLQLSCACRPGHGNFIFTLAPGSLETGKCVACAAGKYSPGGWDSKCASCVNGYTTEIKQSVCQPCSSLGVHGLAGTSADGQRCPCNRDATSPETGMGGAGYNFESKKCELCPLGKVAKDSVCTDCDAGWYRSASLSVCTQCPVGQRDRPAGSASCTDPTCVGPERTFNGACTLCDAGTSAADGINQPCLPCATNYYRAAGSTSVCQLCAASSTKATVLTTLADGITVVTSGAQVCAKCPKGTWYDGTKCTGCASGSTSYAYGEAGYEAWDGKSCPVLCAAKGATAFRGFYSVKSGDAPTICQQCPVGEYAMQDGMSSCVACAAGSYMTGSTAVCTVCAAGKKSDNGGVTGCSVCGEGSSSRGGMSAVTAALGTGSNPITCTECPAGFFWKAYTSDAEAGRGECVMCPDGQYQHESGKSACLVSPLGYKTASYADKVQNKGHKCAAGTFSADVQNGVVAVGATYCQPCAAGTYRSSAQITTAINTDLANGPTNVLSDFACTPCATGFSSTAGLGICAECQAGTYAALANNAGTLSGATQCAPCAIGSYSDVKQATTCASCGEGTWSATSGLSICAACGVGRYYKPNSDPVSDGCRLCDLGQISIASRTSCTNCGVGEFANTAETCLACGPGTSRASGTNTCSACEAGKYSAGGAPLASVGCQTCSGPGKFAADTNGFPTATGATQCSPCRLGRYSVATVAGGSECAVCLDGTYTASAGAVCSDCLGGTYQTLVSNRDTPMTSCSPCNPGHYSGNHAASCTTCDPGTFSGSGQAACGDCPNGKYSASTASVCLGCPTGKFSDRSISGKGPAVDTCSFCPISQAATDASGTAVVVSTGSTSLGATKCTACPTGFYRNLNTQDTCMQCPVGTAWPLDGTTGACTPCVSGTFAANAAGSPVNIGAAQCASCPLGKYNKETTVGVSVCADCVTGQFTSAVGASLCEACPEGRYNGVAAAAITLCSACETGKAIGVPSGSVASGPRGAVACDSCVSGKFADTTGQTACLGCLGGTYTSGTGTVTCTLCPAGKFSVTPSTATNPVSACTDCVPGTFATNAGGSFQTLGATKCSPCLAGTYRSAGLISASFAAGTSGTYTCAPCPSGFFAGAPSGAVGALVCTRCDAGKYSAYGEEGTEEAALGGTTCAACVAGRFQSATGRSTCSLCAVGTYSATNAAGISACTACPNGRYTNVLGTEPTSATVFCDACPQGTYSKFEQKATLSKCADCATGKYASNAGGVGVVEAAETCTDCAAGTYNPSVAQTSCETCAAYTQQPAAGKTICSLCPAGYTSASNFKSCVPCIQQTYSASAGVGCSSCPVGTVSSGSTGTARLGSADVGATGCQICSSGKYKVDYTDANKALITSYSAANLCASSACDSSAVCVNCPAGSYSASSSTTQGVTSCTLCPLGTYTLTPGQSSCTGCPAGKYANQPSEGATDCIECPTGRYKSTVGGSATCDLASIGSWPNSLKTAERFCTNGYSSDFGKYEAAVLANNAADKATYGACYACPAGKYSNAGSDCIQCPSGTVSAPGSALCSTCGAGTIAPTAFFTGANEGKVISDVNTQPDYTAITKTATPYYQDRCLACVANKFSVSGASVCQSCSAGRGSASGDAVCTACAAGTYNDAAVKSSCVSCSTGYASSGGATECFQCLAGKISSAAVGFASCTSCDPGSYQSVAGQGTCTPTGPGYYQGAAGQAQPLMCLPGQFSAASAATCTPCALGKYSADQPEDDGVCKTCAVGSVALAQGLTSCTSCAVVLPGSIESTDRKSCDLCVTGTPVAGDYKYAKHTATDGSGTFNTCVVCPIGRYWTTHATACTQCPAGKYQDQTGRSECKDCTPGRFTAALGGTSNTDSCGECPAGQVSDASGSSCSSCAVGRYKNGLNTCDLCGAGTYSDVTGASVCKPCLAGTYMPAAPGTGVVDPVGTRNACVQCEPGKYTDEPGQSTCKKCGYSQAGGALRGEYTNAYNSKECIACPNGKYLTLADMQPASDANLLSSCKDCPAGTRSGTASGTGALSCPLCASGRYSDVAGQLQDCAGSCPVGTRGIQYTSAGLWGVTDADQALKSEADRIKLMYPYDACQACQAGYQSLKLADGAANTLPVAWNGCLACVAGTKQVAGSTFATLARTLPDASKSVNLQVCEVCADGSDTKSPGQTKCDECPVGRIGLTVGGVKVCEQCPQGRWFDVKGTPAPSLTICYMCASGKTNDYSLAPAQFTTQGTDSLLQTLHSDGYTAEKCFDCNGGYYSNQALAVAANNYAIKCVLCPGGQYSVGVAAGAAAGADACTPCPKGRYGLAGTVRAGVPTVACTACPKGSYQDATGQQGCKTCDAGYVQKSLVNQNVASELLSDETDSPAVNCVKCGAHTYTNASDWNIAANDGHTACALCPAGRSTSIWATTVYTGANTGQTYDGCLKCRPGYVSVAGGPCTPCPTGRYSNVFGQQNECTLCEVGKFNDVTAQTVCVNCLAGRKNPNTGSVSIAACEQCEIGKHAMEAGSSACSECGIGRYADQTGVTQCYTCAKGSYAIVPGRVYCTICPKGTYADQEGLTKCFNCRDGTYTTDTQRSTPCTAGCEAVGDTAFFAPGNQFSQYPNKLALIQDSDPLTPEEPRTTPENGGAGYPAYIPTIYASVTGAVDCQKCPVGRFLLSGNPSGLYPNSAAQVEMYKTVIESVVFYKGRTACDLCKAGTSSAGSVEGASAATLTLACPNCAAGKISAKDGDDCTLCPLYQRPNADAEPLTADKARTKCVACAAGYSSNKVDPATGQDGVCTVCPIGKKGGAGSDRRCYSCPAGRYRGDWIPGSSSVPSDPLQCYVCPAGKTTGAPSGTDTEFNNLTPGSNTECTTTCEAGKFQNGLDTGAGNDAGAVPQAPTVGLCAVCPSYTYSAADAGTCTACEHGKYGSALTTAAAHLSCTLCDGGKFQASTAQGSCGDCAPGRFGAKGRHEQCLECYAGRYYNGQQACTGSGGTVCDDANQCTACDAGKFQASTGQVSCTTCDNGKFGGTARTSQCDSCHAGRYYATVESCIGACVDANQCTICPGGKFSAAGAVACTGCGEGKYSKAGTTGTSISSNNCLTCPTGRFWPVQPGTDNAGDSCDGADANCANPAHVAERACNDCEAGKYAVDVDGVRVCKNCGTGKYSLGNSASCTACDAGTYWSGTVPAGGLTLAQKQAHALTDALDECISGVTNTGCATPVRDPPIGSLTAACTPCPPGTYQSATGSFKCIKAGDGHYAGVKAATAEKCPLGRYHDENDNGADNPADMGFACLGDHETQCKTATDASPQYNPCKRCPGGRFAATTGQFKCAGCEFAAEASTLLGATVKKSYFWRIKDLALRDTMWFTGNAGSGFLPTFRVDDYVVAGSGGMDAATLAAEKMALALADVRAPGAKTAAEACQQCPMGEFAAYPDPTAGRFAPRICTLCGLFGEAGDVAGVAPETGMTACVGCVGANGDIKATLKDTEADKRRPMQQSTDKSDETGQYGAIRCPPCPRGMLSLPLSSLERDLSSLQADKNTCKVCVTGNVWNPMTDVTWTAGGVDAPIGTWSIPPSSGSFTYTATNYLTQWGEENDDVCDGCPAGRYGKVDADKKVICEPCEAGHYCVGGDATGRHPCPVGRWRSTTLGVDADSCTKCVKGTAQWGVDRDTPLKMSNPAYPGTGTEFIDATAQTDIASCKACGKGYGVDREEAQTCDKCIIGRYAPYDTTAEPTCLACDAKATSLQGAAGCYCKTGYFRDQTTMTFAADPPETTGANRDASGSTCTTITPTNPGDASFVDQVTTIPERCPLGRFARVNDVTSPDHYAQKNGGCDMCLAETYCGYETSWDATLGGGTTPGPRAEVQEGMGAPRGCVGGCKPCASVATTNGMKGQGACECQANYYMPRTTADFGSVVNPSPTDDQLDEGAVCQLRCTAGQWLDGVTCRDCDHANGKFCPLFSRHGCGAACFDCNSNAVPVLEAVPGLTGLRATRCACKNSDYVDISGADDGHGCIEKALLRR